MDTTTLIGIGAIVAILVMFFAATWSLTRPRKYDQDEDEDDDVDTYERERTYKPVINYPSTPSRVTPKKTYTPPASRVSSSAPSSDDGSTNLMLGVILASSMQDHSSHSHDSHSSYDSGGSSDCGGGCDGGGGCGSD